jgi:hypothetical protein
MRRVLIAATIMLLLLPVSAQARPHHHHRHYGYICGLTQARFFHLDEKKYALALNFADLPHTDAHPGAVVVQRRAGRALGGGPGGHVSRIVQPVSQCVAIVADEKGTYKRDICKNLVAYVQP